MKLEMKRIPILLVLISLLGFSMAQTQTRTQYTIGVNGMSCPFCAYGLEKKLKKVKNVKSVSIHINKGRAIVISRPDTTLEEKALRKAVKEAGFSVSSLEKEESAATSESAQGGRS